MTLLDTIISLFLTEVTIVFFVYFMLYGERLLAAHYKIILWTLAFRYVMLFLLNARHYRLLYG